MTPTLLCLTDPDAWALSEVPLDTWTLTCLAAQLLRYQWGEA